MYTAHYDNLLKRRQLISEAEANGYAMLHDDFDSDWEKDTEPHGTLTFDEPTPKAAEELYWEAIAEESNSAIHRLKQAWDSWDSLAPREKTKAAQDLIPCMLNLYKDRMWYMLI